MNITVRQCMIGETEWFRRLEGKYHYMGESHGAGDLVRLRCRVCRSVEDPRWT